MSKLKSRVSKPQSVQGETSKTFTQNGELFERNLDEDNIHGGHRYRLRKKYQENGLDGFAEHEVLELLLCESIPYRDVNDLAHRLIDNFGSIKGVLSASPQQLTEFEGMDKATSYNLGLVASLYRYMDANKYLEHKISTFEDILDYSYYLIGNDRQEQLYFVCLDANGFITGKRTFEDKIKTNMLINIQQLAETSLYFRAKQVFVVHSHPLGEHQSSLLDKEFTRKLYDTLLPLGVHLIDHTIVGLHGVYSFFLSGELKYRA